MPGSRFHKPYPPRPNIGERHGRAKLSEADVRAIRARHVWLCGTNGVTALAREYGVSKYTIALVVQRKTWRHVTDEAAQGAPGANNAREAA